MIQLGEGCQFNDVHPAFARFALGNPGLVPGKGSGYLLLGETSLQPGSPEPLQELAISLAVERPHAMNLVGSSSILKSDIPKPDILSARGASLVQGLGTPGGIPQSPREGEE